MIGMDGYLKIIDLGLCKQIADRTMTYCGTIEYMAPEMAFRTPYSFGIDVWGFGVLIYELATGVTPFYNVSGMNVLKNIVEKEADLSMLDE
jgi:serine/threonine protein kinase